MDVVIVWSWDSGQHSPAIVFSQTLEAWTPTFWSGGGWEKRRSRKGEPILTAPYQTTKQTVAPLVETRCFGKNMTSCHVSNSWKMVRCSRPDNWNSSRSFYDNRIVTGYIDLLEGVEMFPKFLNFLALCSFGCTCYPLMQTILKFILLLA